MTFSILKLYQRKNGVWYVSKPEPGRKYPKRISLNTKDATKAQRKFEKLEKKWLTGKLVSLKENIEVISLGAFTKEYLEYASKTKRPATIRADSLALRKLMAHLGETQQVHKITRKQIDLFLIGLNVKPVSRNTYLRHLKAAFNQAIAWGYLPKDGNPCQGIKEFKDEEELPPRYLSAAEIDTLWEAETELRFLKLWKFYLATGCRRAEALQITAADIDLEAGEIVVHHTKSRKTKKIIITPEVEAIIQIDPVAVGRLFPWKLDWVSHRFQKLARKAGIKTRLHDLRHTYITNLVKFGVDPRAVQLLAGHKDPKSIKPYLHLDSDYLRQELKKTEKAE